MHHAARPNTVHLSPCYAPCQAIELLTGCYVMVQGNTVSVMGKHQGLKQVRKLVEDCMLNFHPVYHIKELMIRRDARRALAPTQPPSPQQISAPAPAQPQPEPRPQPQPQNATRTPGSPVPPRRELEKDPALKEESWERFLPSFKKKNAQRKKTKPTKKEYTPFPPAPMPRKVDLEMESGEYFLAAEQKKAKLLAARDAKQDEGAAASKAKRQERFVAPKEQRRGAPGDNSVGAAPERSAAELVATLKAKGKGKRKAEEAPPAAAAVAAPEPKKKKKKKA